MSGSRVAALVITTFFVVASSILLVACCRSRTFSTGVIAAGAAYLIVVVQGASGGLDTCGAELLLEVGDGNIQLREVLQGNRSRHRSRVNSIHPRSGRRNCFPAHVSNWNF